MRRVIRLASSFLFVSLLLIISAPVAAPAAGSAALRAIATIRYTEHGVPHILADNFTGLGYGYGYAVARDNICLLANSYTTVRAQRSRFFGPGGAGDDTVTAATRNLTSDLYFQQINDSGVVPRLAARSAPLGPLPEARDLVAGYVRGYNRFLAETGRNRISDPTCRGGEWVGPITELDVYRLLYAMATYAGQGTMVDGIVNAQPATAPPAATALPAVSTSAPPAATAATAARVVAGLAATRDPGTSGDGIAPGSNGVAVGADGVARGRSVLLGNPHFVWRGVNRFWQSHLTVPGKLNAAGAGLLGTPFLSIGHNATMAWTHTWASPVTFGLYEVRLVPGEPTAYLVDGVREEMTRRTVRVAVKQPDGTLGEVSRTLYATRYGPMVATAAGLPLPWTGTTGYAVRDANATNLRVLNTSLRLAQARNTGDVVQALSRTQGLPLFNTLAVDDQGNALHADIQVVPHVTDELARRCGTPLSQFLFPQSGLSILDGSASTCAWGTDADAVEPGLLGPERLPRLHRRDYVVNSNQSLWLSNPHSPVTGYPRIVGDVATERTPRTREAVISVEEGLSRGGFTRESMQRMLFANRSRVAELAADDTARMCAAFPDGLAPSTGGPVDVRTACQALADWDHTYSLDSRGSLLFERFVMKLVPSAPVPASLPWKVPFDPANPLTTPNTLDTDRADVRLAFGNAAAELRAANIPLDAPLGDHQGVTRNGARIPLPGGAWQLGVLNVIHPVWDPARGNVEVSTGSTYLQVVAFGASRCPDVATLLASSQSADPTSPYHADQTRMFSAGQWATGRFCEADIRASPALRVVHLR